MVYPFQLLAGHYYRRLPLLLEYIPYFVIFSVWYIHFNFLRVIIEIFQLGERPWQYKMRSLRKTREIHPLDLQAHRYCMLASTASAPRVTRCSLGFYWSRDLCSKHALAGWGMSSYLGQIVRGSEIWWFMTSAHSLSTSLRKDIEGCFYY